MINHHKIWVPGEPKAQPRARAAVRGGRARMYDPGTADGWKSVVGGYAAIAGFADMRLSGPIVLVMAFRLQRPTSHFRSGKNRTMLKSIAPQFHDQRPDVDNLAKAVMDALTDVGIWKDDDQVYDLRVTKTWVAEKPGCLIEFWG